jgi:hypothetical protein
MPYEALEFPILSMSTKDIIESIWWKQLESRCDGGGGSLIPDSLALAKTQ